MRKLFSDPPVALGEIKATYGPICSLGADPMQVIVVGGPGLIQQLFATPCSTMTLAASRCTSAKDQQPDR